MAKISKFQQRLREAAKKKNGFYDEAERKRRLAIAKHRMIISKLSSVHIDNVPDKIKPEDLIYMNRIFRNPESTNKVNLNLEMHLHLDKQKNHFQNLDQYVLIMKQFNILYTDQNLLDTIDKLM